MSELPPPNDILRRYILRRGFVKKVLNRLRRYYRAGTRTPLADLRRLFDTPPTTIFDVGANIGYETEAFRAAWPHSRIHAFEPTPQSFAQLVRNVGGHANVHCENAAVSNSDGEAAFQVDPTLHRGGSNSLLPHTEVFTLTSSPGNFRSEIVRTVRLDTFCEREQLAQISILKLDIEGAELMALEGAGALLDDGRIDAVIAEARFRASYGGQPLLADLLTFLSLRGYIPYNIYPFAESRSGQGEFGDVVFLGPQFRRELVARLGAKACGFSE
jgi:FkbM family methyltransferase